MKKIVAGMTASLALVAGGNVWAQAKPAAPAPAAPAAPSPAAAPSPETEKAVKELLTVMKYREMMSASMKQMSKNVPAFVMQATAEVVNKNAKLNPEQKKAALAKAEKDAASASASVEAIISDPKLMDELEKEIVPLYARYFSAQEIRQVTAFYQTPTGAKLLASFPQIMGEASMIAQKIVMPRVAKQVEKFAADHNK